MTIVEFLNQHFDALWWLVFWMAVFIWGAKYV